MQKLILIISFVLLGSAHSAAQQTTLPTARLCLTSPHLAQKAYRLYAPMDLISMADSLYTQNICTNDIPMAIAQCIQWHTKAYTSANTFP